MPAETATALPPRRARPKEAQQVHGRPDEGHAGRRRVAADQTLSQLQADAKAHTEDIHGRSAELAPRNCASGPTTTSPASANGQKAEIARISEETEQPDLRPQGRARDASSSTTPPSSSRRSSRSRARSPCSRPRWLASSSSSSSRQDPDPVRGHGREPARAAALRGSGHRDRRDHGPGRRSGRRRGRPGRGRRGPRSKADDRGRRRDGRGRGRGRGGRRDRRRRVGATERRGSSTATPRTEAEREAAMAAIQAAFEAAAQAEADAEPSRGRRRARRGRRREPPRASTAESGEGTEGAVASRGGRPRPIRGSRRSPSPSRRRRGRSGRRRGLRRGERIADHRRGCPLEAPRHPRPRGRPLPRAPGLQGGSRQQTTQVVVVGLVSVATIASFKRHLGRATGVQSVGVSSGPDGEFVFAVAHGQTSRSAT